MNSGIFFRCPQRVEMKERQEQQKQKQKQKQDERTDEALRVTYLDYETQFTNLDSSSSLCFSVPCLFVSLSVSNDSGPLSLCSLFLFLFLVMSVWAFLSFTFPHSIRLSLSLSLFFSLSFPLVQVRVPKMSNLNDDLM